MIEAKTQNSLPDPKYWGNWSTEQAASAGPPIFIFGITPRSGTNFLYRLIRNHPDCKPGVAWEDHLLRHADLLQEYVTRTKEHWRPNDPTSKIDSERLLHQALGLGLQAFLRLDEENTRYTHTHAPTPLREDSEDVRRTVTKTPLTHNLALFPRLFPNAKLLIIVRDGRDVTVSGMRTFGWSLEAGARKWAQGARAILDFLDEPASQKVDHMVIRYEDLNTQTERVLRDVLPFLDLSPGMYDFSALDEVPVVGSSTHTGDQSEVHWKGVEKTPDFNPHRRWSHWKSYEHSRFNWIAEDYLSAFDYTPFIQHERSRYYWHARNLFQDLLYTIKS